MSKENILKQGLLSAGAKQNDSIADVDTASQQDEETNNYYDLLKNESYKALLQSEIQASVAKDQAMKYTQNSINANGYGTQGLSESTNLGVQNNYRQALREAQNQYQSDITNIETQRRNELKQNASDKVAKDNDLFESITTLMSGATSQEQLDRIYNEYNGGAGLDENSRKQLNLIYGMYSDNLSGAVTNTEFNSTDEDVYATDKSNNVRKVNLNDKFSYEINTLEANIRNNTLPNNSIIAITDEDGYKLYLQYINGRLYYTNANSYNSATTNKFIINGKNNIVSA